MRIKGSWKDSAEERTARFTTEVACDVLERAMLELSGWPAWIDRAAAGSALADALDAMRRLVASRDETSGDHVERLRAAIRATERAHEALRTVAVEGRAASMADDITAVQCKLVAMQGVSIEHSLRRNRKELQGPSALLEADTNRSSGGTEDAGEAALSVDSYRVSEDIPRLVRLNRSPITTWAIVDPSFGNLAEADASNESSESDADVQLSEPNIAEAAYDADGTAPSLEQELEADRFPDTDRPPPEAEIAGLQRITRDVVEEIGVLGLLRAPQRSPGPWANGVDAFEARLMKNLDAFVALGTPYVSANGEMSLDVVAELLKWTGNGAVPDPARAFARAFVLGCLAGEDAARAAVISLLHSHPMTYDSQQDALSLAPNPFVAPLLMRLCADGPPRLTCIALEVMKRRREATFVTVAPLLAHPDASVRAAAASCLTTVTPREAALRLLDEHSYVEEDESVLVATAEALVVLGSRRGIEVARELFEENLALPEAFPEAARSGVFRLLGIAGGPTDGKLLLRALDIDPRAAHAMGWHGDASFAPELIDGLERWAGIPARSAWTRSSALALQRIMGIARSEDEMEGTALGIELLLDPAHWRRSWREHGEKFSSPQKYRFGRPFSPSLVIAEAAEADVSTETRTYLLLELSILSKGASRVSAHDWVVRQRQALESLVDFFQRARPIFPQGQWIASGLGMSR